MGKNNILSVLLSGVLVEDNGKYLLVQEAKDKSYSKCKDKWTLPHGSYDHMGESTKDLAQRELKEETGGSAAFTGSTVSIEGWGKISGHVILISVIWKAKNWIKETEPDSEEIKAVQFFSKEEIMKLREEGNIRDNMPILEIIESFEDNWSGLLTWQFDR